MNSAIYCYERLNRSPLAKRIISTLPLSAYPITAWLDKAYLQSEHRFEISLRQLKVQVCVLQSLKFRLNKDVAVRHLWLKTLLSRQAARIN